MRNFKIVFIFILFAQLGYSNLLYDITDGKFRTKRLETMISMKDGEFYTSIVNNKAVVKYSYKNPSFVDTVFSISRIKNIKLNSIAGYEFSPNEQQLLIYTNVNYRYRRTFTADYYVYDLKRSELAPLSDDGAQEVPLFSPDSRYIAFARKNNLFMKKLDFNTELAITKDGEPGKIINGTPDWVYEEEFEKTRCFVWSPDSKLLAYVKFDETEIPLFSFQQFKQENPLNKEIELYPRLFSFKYPKAGQNNSKVKVCVYDDFMKTTRVMKVNEDEQDVYIPRIQWSNHPDQLIVYKLNRNQNRLDMLAVNPKSTLSKLILRQDDKYYIDYDNIDYIRFSADNQFFYGVSEQDGYRHIYQYKINGALVKQITKGSWDVTDVYGYDEAKKIVYYQSAEVSPLQRDVYAIDSKGKKTRLTDGNGTHVATFNNTFTFFADNASSIKMPNVINLRTSVGTLVRTIDNNNNIDKSFKELNLPPKEFFSFTTSENVKLNGWMVKPANFDSNKKYPVLLVQYSGPNSQQVLDKWSVDWEYYLAMNGYAVVSVDGRGTGARGAEFRKCTYQQMEILEANDQVETAKYLAKQSYIDADRIGIWGWSYGGSITLMAMSTGEKVFKAGIAVAPVTDWKLYNTAYTERFMRRPQENFKGYEQTSALSRAKNINGYLLLVHGTADDNVHVQNTFLYADKLVEADKQFEMQLYTDKNHSILGKQTRRHLYTRMSEFLFKNL
ncbi:MAG TPA: S9 family peptidase [Paludibacter sp.]|nr:S9 family peptidase [Paludibacter sp.]